MRLHRFHIFLIAENNFRMFPMTKGAARLREKRRRQVENYMRGAGPEKYHDLLILDFDRRTFDPGYLESLHSDKVVPTDAKAERITADGIETDKGFIPADVIVLATGFQTNKFISYMDVVGRNGENVSQHCSINYARRVLKPILDGDAASVEFKSKAEHDYVYWVQDALKKRVWNAGCVSWHLNDRKWNSMSYPWAQGYYWWRSLFPTWSDWNIKKIAKPSSRLSSKILLLILLCIGLLGITRSTDTGKILL
ncbi:hypothetical protein BDW68DRAFT_178425 [Aspergillus falconensis]